MTQKIEDVHSYTSKPFDIVVELDNKLSGTYKMTVMNNATKVAVEIREDISHPQLDSVREELIYKWLLELGK